MAWKITLVGGAVMHVDDRVCTPTGFVAPSTVQAGDLVCMFGDGTMVVAVAAVEEIVE